MLMRRARTSRCSLQAAGCFSDSTLERSNGNARGPSAAAAAAAARGLHRLESGSRAAAGAYGPFCKVFGCRAHGSRLSSFGGYFIDVLGKGFHRIRHALLTKLLNGLTRRVMAPT